MKRYNFKTVARVTKKEAEQFFNMGFEVLLIPHKCNPENKFYHMGGWCNMFDNSDTDKFDLFNRLCDEVTYYSCGYNETGRYLAYYVKHGDFIIHFDFADGSNPYIYRGTVWDCMDELKKFGKNFDIKPVKRGFYHLTEKRN